MEYKMHKCCGKICNYYEIHKILERINLMTFYQAYNAAKEAYVFSFSFISNGSVGRYNRKRKKFINKALPNTLDAKASGHGRKKGWPTAPPKHGAFSDGCSRWTYPPTAPPVKLDIFTKKINCRNVTDKCCLSVRGVNNAPPSANKREKSNVHKFVQRENQIESIAV